MLFLWKKWNINEEMRMTSPCSRSAYSEGFRVKISKSLKLKALLLIKRYRSWLMGQSKILTRLTSTSVSAFRLKLNVPVRTRVNELV